MPAITGLNHQKNIGSKMNEENAPDQGRKTDAAVSDESPRANPWSSSARVCVDPHYSLAKQGEDHRLTVEKRC